MRLWLSLAALSLAIAGLAACGSEPLEAHAPIFAEARWTGPERLTYNLRQRDELQGSCVLETHPAEASPGITELRRLCTDAETGRYHDNGFAWVDAETLRPVSALRVVSDLLEGERRFATTYLPERLVRFELHEYDTGDEEPRELTVERDLPEPTEAVPEPGWYDDEELLWLVRGLPLREDFAGMFTNVNASTGRVFAAEVTVEERERVEVPAGTFEAWKIRITSTVTNFYWVESESPYRVVKANIERLTYELTAVE